MGNILIVYYSFSGSTRLFAERIAARTGGTLRELVPERPYAFDYNTAAKEARSQIERGHCPALRSGGEPIDGFDTVFIGTPNWFKSIAPPVLTFLRLHAFAGKAVVPFCTHGGGGFGRIEDEMGRACAGAVLLPGMAASGGVSAAAIGDWLERIGVDAGGAR